MDFGANDKVMEEETKSVNEDKERLKSTHKDDCKNKHSEEMNDTHKNQEEDKIIYHPSTLNNPSKPINIDTGQKKDEFTSESAKSLIHSEPSSLPSDCCIMNVQESSGKSMRTTQSHPKMSRMPRPPALFKVGRTARSLGSISLGNSSENSFGSNGNTPRINVEDDTEIGSSSAGTSTILNNKKGSGIAVSTKQINSQDSLRSSNGRNNQTLFTTESPIDSKASGGSNSITPSVLGTSANALQEESSLGGECEGEEDGAHDTITSLAGVKMIQKYRGSIRKGRRSSQSEDQLSGHQRLEDLFLIEEDGKDETSYDEPIEIISRDDYCKQTDNTGFKVHLDSEKDLQCPLIQAIDVEDEDIKDVFIPPDGGYGWFVALGTFLALFWTAGMIKSYGVIFDRIIITFDVGTSIALAAWIPGIMTTLALATAPITSALCQRFNCRYVTAVGAILSATGIIASSFAGSIQELFVTFGILTGVGVGLSTTPGVILTARYFDKRRGIANAFCLSGTAAGSFTLPFLIEFLLEAYEFRGTMLILGGCMLHILISSALFRPLAVHVSITRNGRKELQSNKQFDNVDGEKGPSTNVDNYCHNCDDLPPLHQLPCCHNCYQDECESHHIQSITHGCHTTHPSHDPNEMARKLQAKLASLDDATSHTCSNKKKITNDEMDNISNCSSCSCQSENEDRSVSNNTAVNKLNTPQKAQGNSKGLGYEFGNSSFASIPYSLPPCLDYQFPVHIHGETESIPSRTTNARLREVESSLASREDLQCNWESGQGSRQESITTHDVDPLNLIKSGNCRQQIPGKRHDDQYVTSFPTHYVSNNAQALSLRELYCRQLGNYFSAYKNLIFGGPKQVEKRSVTQQRKCTRCKNNILHVNEDVAQQSCLRKVSSLPASHYKPAFIVKDDSQMENSLRHNRVSYDSMLNDKDEVDKSSKTGRNNRPVFQNQNSIRLSTKSRNVGSRLSLIFGMEDVMTDSTSILKDSRHPSISTISGSQALVGKKTGVIYGSRLIEEPPVSGRLVTLERSKSVAAASKTVQDLKLSGKAPRYRHRQTSEPAGEIISDDKKETNFADGSNENVLPIKTPPYISTSRFKLFPRRGSKCTSIKEDEDVEEAMIDEIKESDDANIDNKKKESAPQFESTSKTGDNTASEPQSKATIPKTKKIMKTLKKYFNFSLCCNPTFVTMTLAVMCMSLGVPHVLFFLPNYVRSLNVGADPATLLAITSISELIGRISTGIMVDTEVAPKFLLFTIFVGISGTSVVCLPLASNYVSLIIVMSCYGIGIGSWFLMVPLLLADFFGVENIGSSYGLLRLFQSVSNICGPLAAGLIKDATGSFSNAFYLMGTIMSLGVVFSLILGSTRPSRKSENEIDPTCNDD